MWHDRRQNATRHHRSRDRSIHRQVLLIVPAFVTQHPSFSRAPEGSKPTVRVGVNAALPAEPTSHQALPHLIPMW